MSLYCHFSWLMININRQFMCHKTSKIIHVSVHITIINCSLFYTYYAVLKHSYNTWENIQDKRRHDRHIKICCEELSVYRMENMLCDGTRIFKEINGNMSWTHLKTSMSKASVRTFVLVWSDWRLESHNKCIWWVSWE